MLNLLRRLLARFRRKQPEAQPKFDFPIDENLQATIDALSKPVEELPEIKPQPRGRVIKQTHAVEFNPGPSRTGGRVVRVMPRKLQKIKQAQEKFEADHIAAPNAPSIEDLED